MISPLRACMPLAIAVALSLPSTPVDAQKRQVAAQPAPAAPAPPAPPPKPKHGPTPPPIACAKRLVGVDAAQTESFGFWLRAQGPVDQVKVQFSCKLDRTRLIVGLVRSSASADGDGDGEGPAKHSVHVLDLALDPPPARVLRRNLVEGPVVIVRPGGGMSLVFGETTVERGLAYKGYRAVDIATGKVQTFFSLPMEPTGLGCVTGRAMGLERIWVSSEATLVDLGENGPYGITVEHEDGDCKAGKNEKRTDTFIAVPDGFELFK